MDSLMAVELRNRIQRRYQIKLPMVQLLKDGTVTTVAQALATELNSTHTTATTTPDSAAETVAPHSTPVQEAPTPAPAPAAPASVPKPLTAAQPAPQAPASTHTTTDSELLNFLKQEVAVVMGLRAERVNVSRPLNRLGMDSLMAVELRNRIQRRYQIKLPMVQLLKDGTVTTVAQALATELNSTNTTAATAPDSATAPPTAHAAPVQKAAAPAPAPVAPTAVPEPAAADAQPVSQAPAPGHATPDSELLDFLKQEVAVVMGLRAERVNVSRPLNR
ncbi:acyl carrier protein, partial [Streptomyces sp. NPDC060205]|uniref:acyl carrier protein n=1 Tax=Streptomyces sp. NPDC060205 TaxID=3347072 RepID=UPI0036640A30